MIERIESKGYWYLPEKPDETIAGILTYVTRRRTRERIHGMAGSQKAGAGSREGKESPDPGLRGGGKGVHGGY